MGGPVCIILSKYVPEISGIPVFFHSVIHLYLDAYNYGVLMMLKIGLDTAWGAPIVLTFSRWCTVGNRDTVRRLLSDLQIVGADVWKNIS